MYLLVFKIEQQYILSVSEENGISAYNTLQEVLSSFQGYIDAFKRNYESAMSATLGLMNTHPTAVEYNEPAESLQSYLIDSKPYRYTGMMGSSPILGTPIKTEFLEGKNTTNIWKEVMIAAGISDPMESVITNPINFSL